MVSLPRRDNSLPSMASFWMNLQRLAFELHLLDLQVARKFEEHDARAALLHIDVERSPAVMVREGSSVAFTVYLEMVMTCGVHSGPLGPPKRASESGVLRSERMGKLIQRS